MSDNGHTNGTQAGLPCGIGRRPLCNATSQAKAPGTSIPCAHCPQLPLSFSYYRLSASPNCLSGSRSFTLGGRRESADTDQKICGAVEGRRPGETVPSVDESSDWSAGGHQHRCPPPSSPLHLSELKCQVTRALASLRVRPTLAPVGLVAAMVASDPVPDRRADRSQS